MSKIHYFSSKFSKIAKCWRLSNFNFGDKKFHNLAKLWFFKLIMMKLSLENSAITSSSFRC